MFEKDKGTVVGVGWNSNVTKYREKEKKISANRSYFSHVTGPVDSSVLYCQSRNIAHLSKWYLHRVQEGADGRDI